MPLTTAIARWETVMDFGAAMAELSIWVMPLLAAVTLHEAAHAWTASMLGDDTSRDLGRVSLDPLRHVDPVGTILVPLLLWVSGAPFLIGWAKSVPVDVRNLRDPVADMGRIALSGPLANMVLAGGSALLLPLAGMLPDAASEWATTTLFVSVYLNVVLGLFNLIPLPPLDGSRIAVWLLPTSVGVRFAELERYGMLPLVGLVFVLPSIGDAAGIDLDVLGWTVGYPASFVSASLVEMFVG